MEKIRQVFKFSATRQQLIDLYKARLRRVENGEMWDCDHSGSYTAEERAQEITRLESQIARLGENASRP
jgi:hypothetical protein